MNSYHTFNKNSENQNFTAGAYLHHHLRSNFKKALINKQPVAIQPVACNSYVNTFVLDPYGKIYPCWDVTDDIEHCIGTYYPQITENKQVLLKWRNRELTIFEKCIRCPYVFYCGGGCAIKANLKTGRFDDIDCDSFPYIFQTHFAHAYNNRNN